MRSIVFSAVPPMLLLLISRVAADAACVSGETAVVVAGTCTCVTVFTSGVICPSDPNGVPGCTTGGTACYIACNPGYTDVGGVCTLAGTGVPGRKRRRELAAEKKKRVAAALQTGPNSADFITNSIFCPKPGQIACRVEGASSGEFECVDPKADLRSCGGCTTIEGKGTDCTKIEGANSVQCQQGHCAISSCKHEYQLVQGYMFNSTCIRSPRKLLSQFSPLLS